MILQAVLRRSKNAYRRQFTETLFKNLELNKLVSPDKKKGAPNQGPFYKPPSSST
jgi:hypothetical protein